MGQRVRIPFPLLAIKGLDHDFDRCGFQASDIDIVAVRIGTRNVKGFYSACFTKLVLGDPRIEGIRHQVVFAGEQVELRFRYDEMEKAGLRANRAVTELALDAFGCVDFERYGAAMTASTINHGSNISLLLKAGDSVSNELA